MAARLQAARLLRQARKTASKWGYTTAIQMFSDGEVGPMVHGLNLGDVVPDFTLKSLDGSDVSLSDYRGGRLLIFCWGSW